MKVGAVSLAALAASTELLRLLIAKGLLSRQDGQDLLAETAARLDEDKTDTNREAAALLRDLRQSI
jgi:hypothetical protein